MVADLSSGECGGEVGLQGFEFAGAHPPLSVTLPVRGEIRVGVCRTAPPSVSYADISPTRGEIEAGLSTPSNN